MTEDKTENALFGTPDFFELLQGLMEEDAVWQAKASGLTVSMVYLYGPPMNRAMFVRFEAGKLVEYEAVSPADPPASEITISANGAVWKAIVDQELKPTLAMATGKVKVKGKQTLLLKNMAAFGRLMELQTTLDVSYDA